MQKIVKDITPELSHGYTKKCVAAYARVSSGKDAMLHSLVAQVEYYSNYIQQNPEWEFAGVYADEAISGTKANRCNFNRLMHDCRAGLIHMVITKSISRFARNTVVMLETVRELKLLGVDVYFEEQDIHSISGDGELMLTIMASFAQEEALSCSENCKWRIRNNFKDGIPNNLQLYGYDFVDKTLLINPQEAEVVKMIFTDYLNGMGKHRIVRKLTELGIPTKCNGRWSENGIDKILRNEKYAGNMLLQKTFSISHMTRSVRKNNGELPMYFVRDTHESIVSQSIFEAVQSELINRAKIYASDRKSKEYSEFTGKIRCGICGANYRQKTTASQKAWCCSTFVTLGKAFCGSKQIPDNILKKEAAASIGLEQYSPEVFSTNIGEIRIPDAGLLVFVFTDGHEVVRTWENRSRSESWTNEMREQARSRSMKAR